MPKFEGGDSQQELKRREKVRAWQNKLEEIGRIKDALGFPVDENIRETVVALNLSGITTSASCEGHLDRARGAPWIRIQAPHRPPRFINEDAIIEAVAQKYHVSPNEVRTDQNHEAWKEATNLAAENGETPEYQTWRKENQALQDQLIELLEEFYRGRTIEPDVRLELLSEPEGTSRIRNGGENYRKNRLHQSEDERSHLAHRLLSYQNEMKAFAIFLSERYFSSP